MPALVLRLANTSPSSNGTKANSFLLTAMTQHGLATNYLSRRQHLSGWQGWRFQRVRTAVYSGSWKAIRSSNGPLELYDLSVDPEESKNLANRTKRVGAPVEIVEEMLSAVEPTAEPVTPPTDRDAWRRSASGSARSKPVGARGSPAWSVHGSTWRSARVG